MKSVKIENLNLNICQSKNNQLIFQCLECKKNYNKDCNKELIKRFASTYESCNEDINKFVPLLRKGVYILMNTWRAEKDLMKHRYQIKKLFTVN